MHTQPRHAEYVEQTAPTTRSLYAAPHRLTRHRLTPLDLPRGEDVRAPGEAPGLLAVESAMDELAHALGMDPVELRIRNEPDRRSRARRAVQRPAPGRVHARGRAPVRLGAPPRRSPASVREGRWLVGYGMAAAIRPHFQAPTKARVRLEPDGIAVVQSDMTDIGTGHLHHPDPGRGRGARAADRSRAGRARATPSFPVSGGSGGSWGAANSSTAVHRACVALREKLLRRRARRRALAAARPGSGGRGVRRRHVTHR